MKAKLQFTRTIKEVKQDREFMEFLAEMFTTNGEDDITHPELIVLSIDAQKRVVVNFDGEQGWRHADAYVLKCNQCGQLHLDWLTPPPDDEQRNRFCDGCDVEFTEIGESGEIEW